MKQSVAVKLHVYDLLGNQIATLDDEVKEQGIYEVKFSADGLASGIYIYQLFTAEFVETRKMVLL
ncbi:MAG: T9SS type A sorting domain-containing protein [bacterium]|nr:T9SS type A sorting domain-containing protein [bacterium]